MPVIHYFKSKKHKRCQEPSVGSCRCWLCKSCKVFLSRHPHPHPSRVKFNWFHIRVSWYAFLFLSFRVFGSIWKYRMQWFSWRTCTVRAAGANVECRRHELLRASGDMPPGKFVKLESLKCNLLRSLDRNWGSGILTGIISFFFRLYALHN